VGLSPRWVVSLFVVAVTAGFAALPAPATATSGAAQPCALAQALESLGRLSAAEAAYTQELANPASAGCAVAGLQRLGGLDALCGYAEALDRDGERQSAHAAYLQVLALNPSSRCANRGVAATLPPNPTSVWTTAGNIAQDTGHAIVAILLALLLVGVAILLWLQIQTRAPWFRDQWPANKIRRPTFSVEPLTDTGTDPLGPAVAGLIRGRVTWRTDGFGLNLVSGQAGIASAFSGLGEASSEASAAVAVVTFLTSLLPRRRFQLTGQLQPPGEEGVGISLELSQNGDAVALWSFWGASFDCAKDSTATAYQQLAVACAAWADIWMTKTLGGGLLTDDPQSWAFFRCGLDAQRLDNGERAQILYEQALAADATNVGAMANLGIIFRRPPHRKEDAEDYLLRALKLIEGDGTAPGMAPKANPDWYRIRYQLAALYANWAAASEPGKHRETRADRATKEAKALAIDTLKAIKRRTRSRRGKGVESRAYVRDTLRPFLEGTIEPSVLTLLAGTISPLPPRPAGWPGKRWTREQVLNSLVTDAIDPWALIAYVEKGPNRPAETQFNLACFYTQAGDLTTAPTCLQRSVRETQRQERQRVIDAALIDPVLAPLLQKRPGIVAKLYEMVDAKKPEDAAALTQHFDLQDRTISHFQSQGWNIAWDKDADLTASKGSKALLIRMPDPHASGETLEDVSGVIQTFKEEHREIKDVKVSVVLPAVTDYQAAAIAVAREHDLEVLQYTGHGFEPLKGG
jgi:tetratricopeptide (TPR) repeat protein